MTFTSAPKTRNSTPRATRATSLARSLLPANKDATMTVAPRTSHMTFATAVPSHPAAPVVDGVAARYRTRQPRTAPTTILPPVAPARAEIVAGFTSPFGRPASARVSRVVPGSAPYSWRHHLPL